MVKRRRQAFYSDGSVTTTYEAVAYSIQHPVFTELRNYWYPDGVKRIPIDFENYLTAITLAYWFIGDGSKNGESGLSLHTQGFSGIDQLFLQLCLKKALKLDTTLCKSGKYQFLIFNLNSSKAVVGLIKPWVLPCVEYKYKHIT